jgi:hypothetical protein
MPGRKSHQGKQLMPKKTFGPGNPGKPQGARNRLAYRVFEDTLAHWCEPVEPGSKLCKGQAALEALHKEKPGEYLRFTGSILPKELAIEKSTTGMSVEDWDETIAEIREILHARQAEQPSETAH